MAHNFDIVWSDRLADIIADRIDDADADASCTAGYDSDGSTGAEIFENGLRLGAKLAASPEEWRIFGAHVEGNEDGPGSNYFVIAASEDDACGCASEWPLDERD